ncbi:MAG TPA: translation elongation factor 4 [bacterium]|jgi:GTP-binding protein LepA|nr:MAG: Elongation factor 4 [Parcubacteria group bacterium ADurb.Bin016]HNU89765.1 translation elongation factor 4 [bacterium]HPU91989.1 translation elongation factor 4 [bacterium]HPX64456.1 translation elongation factor 4 [bacterium]HQB26366.1 translation elongation factor 4 [bacterium]
MKNIRNFCIIAHIDHGKSTLADRLLELTGTIEPRKMTNQILDRLDLERERGITIKLTPVRLKYRGYELNLIDTPGHVDFSYEVSRSLAAVEGAILLVDATQGIQAQTLANLYLAIEQNLVIIPVINKIDLPAAEVEKTKGEIVKLLGYSSEEIICISAKTGEGVIEILDRIIKVVPAPAGEESKPLRALIFDSNYDKYRGVVAYIRVFDGVIHQGEKIKLLATGAVSEALEVGFFDPNYHKSRELQAGEIGYVVTNFHEVSECRVGDTLTLEKEAQKIIPLKGYTEVKPMVFAGVFPKEGDAFENLREAMGRLKLNDAALVYEPEQSQALGYGFRCGFLGLLHLEIFQERLRREFNLDLIVTVPSVAYKIYRRNGDEPEVIRSPQQLPSGAEIDHIEEPWIRLDIITPKNYLGAVMKLAQEKRGVYRNTEYLDETRVILHYEMPLSMILTDFYDKLKSLTSGYGSINYEMLDYRRAEVVRLDIMVADHIVEPLATIVYRDEAFKRGKEIVTTLKESLPREMFVIKLQAVIGGQIIAAERISALRKDVTAKLYGGDVTRKRKLLEKQRQGKKKMMALGRGQVDIPSEVFVKLLKH